MATLVARDDEVASATRSVRAGRGVVIVGEAGVGKTALASAVAERAGLDASAAWIVATAASRLIPFGALGALRAAGRRRQGQGELAGLALGNRRRPGALELRADRIRRGALAGLGRGARHARGLGPDPPRA